MRPLTICEPFLQTRKRIPFFGEGIVEPTACDRAVGDVSGIEHGEAA